MKGFKPGQPAVVYEIVRDGVRATVRREDQGFSIVLAPADQTRAGWADNLELSGEIPEVRAAIAEAENWLRSNPIGRKPESML